MTVNNEDFELLILCAIRYCEGRQTYMPSTIQGIILANLNNISTKTIKLLLNEKENQVLWGNWGSSMDKQDWLNFYDKLEEQLRIRN